MSTIPEVDTHPSARTGALLQFLPLSLWKPRHAQLCYLTELSSTVFLVNGLQGALRGLAHQSHNVPAATKDSVSEPCVSSNYGCMQRLQWKCCQLDYWLQLSPCMLSQHKQ